MSKIYVGRSFEFSSVYLKSKLYFQNNFHLIKEYCNTSLFLTKPPPLGCRPPIEKGVKGNFAFETLRNIDLQCKYAISNVRLRDECEEKYVIPPHPYIQFILTHQEVP